MPRLLEVWDIDSIIQDVAVDVEDLVRNTLKKIERQRRDDDEAS